MHLSRRVSTNVSIPSPFIAPSSKRLGHLSMQNSSTQRRISQHCFPFRLPRNWLKKYAMLKLHGRFPSLLRADEEFHPEGVKIDLFIDLCVLLLSSFEIINFFFFNKQIFVKATRVRRWRFLTKGLRCIEANFFRIWKNFRWTKVER